MTNYESLVKAIVSPLIVHYNDLKVELNNEDGFIVLDIFVRKDDLGRVIGRNGKIASAIRTVLYAAASKDEQKLKVNIYENSEAVK